MFSKTCQYSIRAIIYIAIQSRKNIKVSIKDVSNEIDSPEYFTGKILQKLSKRNFVKSLKGPNGGFFMEKEDFELRIIDIVKEVDGDLLFTACGIGLKECSEIKPCPIHDDYKIIKNKIQQMLESYKIGMLVDNEDLKSIFLK